MFRNVKIEPALNGYIVYVGCQRVVFDSRRELLSTLERYLDNPAVVEAEFKKNALNPMSELTAEADAAPALRVPEPQPASIGIAGRR